jgi:hypothetical protein
MAWEWPYDEPLVAWLREAFRARQWNLVEATPATLPALLAELNAGKHEVLAFWDRASDTNPAFFPVTDWAARRAHWRVNAFEHARRAWIKTNLHWQLIQAGIKVPHTLYLPAFERQPEIVPLDLAPLSVPFSIKPNLGGGGHGVITNATEWADVLKARRALPGDDLILQEFIHPALFEVGTPRRAWFRVLHFAGRVIPCWWSDVTHLYGGPVTEAERFAFALEPLWRLTTEIAALTHLDVFSTEIAVDAQRHFIVVDYANDPIDLRPQSKAPEGAPDAVLWQGLESLLERIKTETEHHPMFQPAQPPAPLPVVTPPPPEPAPPPATP